MADSARVCMNKSFNTLVINASEFENLQFLENDCRNYINKVRHLCLGKGTIDQALYAYLMRSNASYE